MTLPTLKKVLLLLIALFVISCGSAEPEPTNTPAVETQPEATEETVEPEEEANEPEEEMAAEVTVSHPQGETTVMTRPERIVVFDYSVLDTLHLLGVGDSVVGTVQGPTMPDHLAAYNAEPIVNVGTFFEADLEAVNALQPDLIVVAGRSSSLYEDLSAIAPTLDASVDSADVVNSIEAYAENLGTIFAVEDAVATQLADLQAHIDEVAALAAASGYQGLIVLTTGGEVSGYGPGSRFGMIHDLLDVAPTTETMVAETHGDAISFEFILEQNPDVIYVIDRDSAIGAEGETAQQILDNELVNSTTAGANDNIIYLDPAYWYLANAGLFTFDQMISEVAEGLPVGEMMEESGGEDAEMGAVTVTHPQGETTVAANPERVVVFDYSVLDTLDTLGLGDTVVGTVQGPSMLDHLAAYNEDPVTNVGTFFEADLEAVNALQPDLIIVAGRSAGMYEDLSGIAPTVDATVDAANLLGSVQAYTSNIGAIFGVQDEVNARLGGISQQIAEVRGMAEASGYQGLIVLTSGGEVSGYGPGSRFGAIHDVLGVAPTTDTMVAETHGDAISFEFILEQNPDVIYVIDRDSAIGAESETAQQILDNELVNSTTAGMNDNIIYLNSTFWYLASAGLNTIEVMIDEIAEGVSADMMMSDDDAMMGEVTPLPRTVTDYEGNEVVIEDDSAIIALDGPLTEIVFALGAGDRVVASDSSSTYPEAVAELPQVGYVRSLSAEPVLAMAPSLILTTDSAGPPEAVEQLRESGVTVVQFTAPETVDESYQLVRDVAAALGLEAAGEDLVAKMEADLAEAQELLAGTETTPRVMFIYARGMDTVMAAGSGTSVDVMFELSGLENAVTEWEGYQPLTAEGAVTVSPDGLLLFDSGLASVGGAEGLLGVPGLAETPAGENMTIHSMDGLKLTGLGPRLGEAVIELIQLFHPEFAE